MIMLDSFRFHHIGIAVKSIEKTAQVYENGGFERSRTILDKNQHVNICWLRKEGMPTMELIEPEDEKSPISQVLGKNKSMLYHTCYVVDNIIVAIEELREQNYVQVSHPVEAAAMNGSRACFMFNKNIGLIELVEHPAEITV